MNPSAKLAQRLALAVPALLLAGAYLSEYGFGLYPCELCWWQRYAHFAALALAVLSFLAPPRKAWVALAALAVLASGLIGAWHAGIEYHWWEGLTTCSRTFGSGSGDALTNLLNAPLIRCDQAQWRLFGISLAGFNALFSLGGAALILWLCLKKA